VGADKSENHSSMPPAQLPLGEGVASLAPRTKCAHGTFSQQPLNSASFEVLTALNPETLAQLNFGLVRSIKDTHSRYFFYCTLGFLKVV